MSTDRSTISAHKAARYRENEPDVLLLPAAVHVERQLPIALLDDERGACAVSCDPLPFLAQPFADGHGHPGTDLDGFVGRRPIVEQFVGSPHLRLNDGYDFFRHTFPPERSIQRA